MFERFTDRARRVVHLAYEEATALNHDHIGTEHLLLALLREGEGVAATVLAGLGVSVDRVHPRLVEIAGRGRAAPTGHLPFTPRVKQVLELSGREATLLGHRGVSTEHLLLSLVREGRSAAAQLLHSFGVDLAVVLEHTSLVLSRQNRGIAPPARPPAREAAPVAVRSRTPELDARIAEIRAAKEAAVDDQDFERAATLRAQEKELLRQKPAPPS